jgi:hypothetical protein
MTFLTWTRGGCKSVKAEIKVGNGSDLLGRHQRALALIILLLRFSLRIRFFSHFPRISMAKGNR